jgi:tetratricopeptide (TPR) repeat protein
MQAARERARSRVGLALVVVGVVLYSLVAFAADAGPARGDGGADAAAQTDAGGDAAAPVDPRVAGLQRTAADVRALIAGTLDVDLEPSSLFTIPLDDEPAIRVEVERLVAITQYRETPPVDAGAVKPLDALKTKALEALKLKAPDTAPADAGTARAELDPKLWSAQLDLDTARLKFLGLPKLQRDALLEQHAARQKTKSASEPAQQLSEAERKGQLADQEREQALDAARRARTEAERMIAEERARLLEVKGRQADFEVELVKREKALADRHEQFLSLQRRVGDALDAAVAQGPIQAATDPLYDEVRLSLRAARADLSNAASSLGSNSAVPQAGEDKLDVLPADVDRSVVNATRADVERIAATLAERETTFRADRAAKLYEQVLRLNQDRLSLLPQLTPSKRNAITGFGSGGLDQANAELRQVTVVLHYHFTLARRWLASLGTRGGRGRSALSVGFVLLKVLVPVFAFIWWRRRASELLESLRESLRGEEKGLSRSAPPSRAEHALTFMTRIRAPLEWLLLLFAVLWFLPIETKGLLEVRLTSTIFTWTFGGALVVQTVDALAGQDSNKRMRKSRLLTAHIRLRSLQLVGRVVVVVGLILALSDRIVGKGTIYGWVLGLCWLAAIPIALLLLKWWRPVIFERITLKRRKNRVEQLVVDGAEGWKSYPAAALGGVILIGSRAVYLLRAWVGRFDVTRRLLAYLFRREISKKTETSAEETLGPLEAPSFEALGPEVASRDLVPSEADEQVDEIIRRIRRPGGGVFAVVGERGGGKTTVLQRISREAPGVHVLQCPFGGMRAFAPALLEALSADEHAVLEDVAKELDLEDRDAGILLDDAHRLIRPMMGGLAAFDRVLDLARSYSQNVSWVFAFDEVIWRFFERMRGARPTFDDVIRLQPWSEDAIVRLLTARSKTAGVTPSFKRLVGQLATDADDIDYEEAEERTAASYYRLLWDHANGNPGVALHSWRRSLGVDPEGAVTIRAFSPPGIDELEALPDTSVFVLRAVVQLERAQPDELCNATGIPATEVEDALRFGLGRGYFKKSDDGYRVTWQWFRTITRFLRRRHLLFAVGEMSES